MNVSLLFGGWRKEAKKPVSYRPQLLTLENRESPGGLFSGLSAGNLLDGTAPALDPLGLQTEAARSARVARAVEATTASGLAANADYGQCDLARTRLPRWEVSGQTDSTAIRGEQDLNNTLPAPTDVVGELGYHNGHPAVDLRWGYMSDSARHFQIYRSCDGGRYVPIGNVDYPQVTFQDVNVVQNQVCTYGVQAQNGLAHSPMAYSNRVQV